MGGYDNATEVCLLAMPPGLERWQIEEEKLKFFLFVFVTCVASILALCELRRSCLECCGKDSNTREAKRYRDYGLDKVSIYGKNIVDEQKNLRECVNILIRDMRKTHSLAPVPTV